VKLKVMSFNFILEIQQKSKEEEWHYATGIPEVFPATAELLDKVYYLTTGQHCQRHARAPSISYFFFCFLLQSGNFSTAPHK
jgi:hypothetical protein